MHDDAVRRIWRGSRATRSALGLALALPLALAGCGGGGSPDVAQTKRPEPVRARLAQAVREEIPQEVELPGSVEAERTAEVSSRVVALVTAVRAQVGDVVRRGQLLVEIDPRTAAGQLSQARGGLAQAEAARALARRNLDRFEALARTQAASGIELDQARMQLATAEGAVEGARGAVSAAASVAAESRVVAPFAGRVVARMVEAGDLAAPGRPLLRIEAEGGKRFVVAVPESLWAPSGLRLGAKVRVAIDARPELAGIEAPIVEVAPGADPATHAFTVKLELPGAGAPSGSFGRAGWPTGKRSAIVVPRGAVIAQGGASLVVERDAQGQARSRVVTLGATLPGERLEILSGLSGGETLLLDLAAVPPLGSPVEEVR